MVLLAAAGVLVGRGKVPAGGGWASNPGTSTFTGYAVLYPFGGTDEATSLAQTHASLDFPFQLTCVGATQDQAAGVMDAARAALIGVTPAVVGRTAYPVYPVPLSRPITRDDAVAPPVHYGTLQFHFRSDPA
ncbi:hypothetical protein OG884_18825 [Streptosporangium sp. NBC_01755]|uniref:hypothetical protein n=1 Tax=Streptosporangium sp. NBC_01755 TaxID=2975949 RepID=UPI002DDAB9EC|nr:hypothetical protein [Streptosporangium sp. NBC_01755]WSD03863.1 hypothetical protein OG884_18825 [Streptosporangium sp. NBC_01755]